MRRECLWASIDPPLGRGVLWQPNWRLEAAGVTGRYDPADVWLKLEHLRKDIKLPKIKVHAAEPTVAQVRPLDKGLFG